MSNNYNTPEISGDNFDSLSVIRKRLKMEDASHEDLKGFLMFKSLAATIIKSLKSVNQKYILHVSIAEYFSSYPTGKSSNSGTNQYLFGYLKMKVKYPKTYIHKETMREKLTDLILKHDVDFEHNKKFSERFQVLTVDKQQLQYLLQFKNLDTLTAYPDMELEFNNEACLFRCSRKSISIEETDNFCELANTLLTIFN